MGFSCVPLSICPVSDGRLTGSTPLLPLSSRLCGTSVFLASLKSLLAELSHAGVTLLCQYWLRLSQHPRREHSGQKWTQWSVFLDCHLSPWSMRSSTWWSGYNHKQLCRWRHSLWPLVLPDYPQILMRGQSSLSPQQVEWRTEYTAERFSRLTLAPNRWGRHFIMLPVDGHLS